jgi:hypothetical protein
MSLQRARRPALLACLALCPTPVVGQGAGGHSATRPAVLPPQAIAAKASPAVVRIQALDASGKVTSQGSGFVVTADGTLVTNYHVVEGAAGLRVHLASGETYDNVYFLTADARRDLAVLRIPLEGAAALRLGSDAALAVGERVYAMGAPMGLEGTFSDGLVSAKRTVGGLQLVQVTAPISHGSSGGPILNQRGEAVAVATLLVEEGQNLNLAVPARYIRPLLALGERPRLFSAALVPVRTATARATASHSTEGGPTYTNPYADSADQRFWEPRPLADPSGTYSVRSLGDATRGAVDGRLVIAPYGAAGYAAFGLYNIEDSAGQTSEARQIITPMTARPDGRIAAVLDGQREGAHLGRNLLVLAAATTTLEAGVGRDFLVLTPSEDRLSAPSGVYAVQGRMHFRQGRPPATAWEGTVGFTTTGFESKRHQDIVALVLQLASPSSDYGPRAFTAAGELAADGTFTCSPETLSNSEVSVTYRVSGTVRSGTMHLTIDVEADDGALSHRYLLQGTKTRP